MPLDRHKTVKQALEYVERHPNWPAEDTQRRSDMTVWEVVARNLFDTANHPDTREVGSMARATRAQRMILDRLTGTRRAGTHPAVSSKKKIVFRDLTEGYTPPPVEEPKQEEDDE